jgi:hypothetical protein
MVMQECSDAQPDLRDWGALDVAAPQAYTLTLSTAQRDELLARTVLCEAVRPGAAFEQITAAEFALPGWQTLLEEARDQLTRGRGFVLIRGLPFESCETARARRMAWGVGVHFGAHVSQTIEGNRICDVTDASKGERSPRQYRTNRELSLHTDPASDLIGLACYRPARHGGESVLVSARRIHDTLAARHPELLAELAQGFIVHRYGEGLSEDGAFTGYRVPMLIRSGGVVSCRYVRPTIVAGHLEAGVPLRARQIEALDRFDAIARDPANQARFRLAGGDLVVVNNLGVLHARTEFEDFEPPQPARLLFRLWLQAPAGFRSVPAAMNYFNRGRCGIPVQRGRHAEYDPEILARAMDAARPAARDA